MLSREEIIAQAAQLDDDADRVLLLVVALSRALGLDLDAPGAVDPWDALRSAYDHAETMTGRRTRIVPERWADGAVSHVWARDELERAFESMRRLQAGALTPLVAQMHLVDASRRR